MGKFEKPNANRGNKVALSSSATARVDYGREQPTFCLRYVQESHCITKCGKDEQAAFAVKILRMSKMTWNDLIQADRHGMGQEKISQSAIRSPLPRFLSEDITLIAFRFSGLKAMVGYRTDGMFHVLWFDRDFTLYNHGG